jgi:hypothetical protein
MVLARRGLRVDADIVTDTFGAYVDRRGSTTALAFAVD